MTEGQQLNEDEASILPMVIPVGLVVLIMVMLFSIIDIKQ
jgi:hypothetical protein